MGGDNIKKTEWVCQETGRVHSKPEFFQVRNDGLYGLNSSLNLDIKLFFYLCGKATPNNRVNFNSVGKNIARAHFNTSIATLKNAIRSLVKKRLILKSSNSQYMVNPSLILKGNIEQMVKAEKSWNILNAQQTLKEDKQSMKRRKQHE